MTQTATESDISGQELPADQEKALAALMTSATIEAAAKKAGITARTLHRWLHDPEFRRVYLAARRCALEQATGVLQRASHAAVKTLERNLTCGTPSVEVSAARTILDYGLKAVEMQEFEQRLAAVEQSLSPNESKGGTGYA